MIACRRFAALAKSGHLHQFPLLRYWGLLGDQQAEERVPQPKAAAIGSRRSSSRSMRSDNPGVSARPQQALEEPTVSSRMFVGTHCLSSADQGPSPRTTRAQRCAGLRRRRLPGPGERRRSASTPCTAKATRPSSAPELGAVARSSRTVHRALLSRHSVEARHRSLVGPGSASHSVATRSIASAATASAHPTKARACRSVSCIEPRNAGGSSAQDLLGVFPQIRTQPRANARSATAMGVPAELMRGRLAGRARCCRSRHARSAHGRPGRSRQLSGPVELTRRRVALAQLPVAGQDVGHHGPFARHPTCDTQKRSSSPLPSVTRNTRRPKSTPGACRFCTRRPPGPGRGTDMRCCPSSTNQTRGLCSRYGSAPGRLAQQVAVAAGGVPRSSGFDRHATVHTVNSLAALGRSDEGPL